jgi:nucleotide-binding universal stress UspA family protein
MNFPFRRILCPIDFDSAAETVLAVAAQIAQAADDTHVIILHVVPFVMAPVNAPIRVDIGDPQEAARAHLRAMAHRNLKGIRYETSTHVGDVAATILRAQKQFGADVIVMATHGRRGLSRAFLGSVAERVLRESTCPVLVVRATEPNLEVVGQ